MEQKNLAILIISAALIISLIVLFLVFTFYRRKITEIQKHNINFDDSKIPIPLLASFGRIKFLPSFLAIGHNSINPQLILLKDGMEYRLFPKKYKDYSDIELVDITVLPGTRNLDFRFKNSIFTFSANVFDEANLKNALKFLQKKNCPLSDKAKEFLLQ